MFITNLDVFKVQEKELHRQADQYRLARSLGQRNRIAARVYESLGRMLIQSGQQLVDNTRAAAH